MKGLAISTRSIVFHDDGSVEIVYQEEGNRAHGIVKTEMLQFPAELYLSRTVEFQQECQDFIDDVLVCLREGPPE